MSNNPNPIMLEMAGYTRCRVYLNSVNVSSYDTFKHEIKGSPVSCIPFVSHLRREIVRDYQIYILFDIHS